MQPVSSAYLDAIKTGYELAPRITLLDEDDNEIEELTGADGYAINATVLMDRTRLPRRTVDMTIVNEGGLWTPKALAGKLWLQKRFKVQHGVTLPSGAVEYTTLGTFMVDRPRVTFPETTVVAQGTDYWRIGYKRKFRSSVSFGVSTRLEVIVSTLGTLAGFSTSRMRLDDSSRLTTTQIVLPFGADVLAELTKIVTDHAHEVYADYDGWLTLAPSPTAATAGAPVYSLYEGEDAVLLRVSKDWSDDRLYNAAIVVAEGAQREVVTAEARDLNPASPAYNPSPGTDPDWPNGGPLGDRLLPIEYTSRLADEYAAYQRASALLFENSMVEETYSLDVAPIGALMPGDVVGLQHRDSDTDDDLLIDSIRLGTKVDDDQALGIKKLRSLSA